MKKRFVLISLMFIAMGFIFNHGFYAFASEEIKQAQRGLKNLGYYPAMIDGIVGPMTRKAIVQYQYNTDLQITGILDPVTMKYLRRPSVILNTQDFAPFHYKTNRKGEAHGPIPQIVKMTCQSAGINCRIVLYDQWRVAQESVKNGRADGMFVIAWNSERAKWLHRSTAIVETAYGLFVREDDGLQFNQILKQPKEMEGYTVGVYGPSGTSTSLKKLKNALDSRGVKIFINMEPDDKPLFQKLSASKGKYAVYSNKMVGETITRGLGLDNTRFAGMHRGLSYYVGFSKQRVPLSVVQKFDTAFIDLVKKGRVLATMANYSMPSAKGGNTTSQKVSAKTRAKPRMPHRFSQKTLDGRMVVLDTVSCLMWQQAGTYEHFSWNDAFAYVDNLNKELYAGFSDWRLPDIGELSTLIEPELQKKNRMYINPVFDTLQQTCWSANTSEMDAQFIDFYEGAMGSKDKNDTNFVRAVRTSKCQ